MASLWGGHPNMPQTENTSMLKPGQNFYHIFFLFHKRYLQDVGCILWALPRKLARSKYFVRWRISWIWSIALIRGCWLIEGKANDVLRQVRETFLFREQLWALIKDSDFRQPKDQFQVPEEEQGPWWRGANFRLFILSSSVLERPKSRLVETSRC